MIERVLHTFLSFVAYFLKEPCSPLPMICFCDIIKCFKYSVFLICPPITITVFVKPILLLQKKKSGNQIQQLFTNYNLLDLRKCNVSFSPWSFITTESLNEPSLSCPCEWESWYLTESYENFDGSILISLKWHSVMDIVV